MLIVRQYPIFFVVFFVWMMLAAESDRYQGAMRDLVCVYQVEPAALNENQL